MFTDKELFADEPDDKGELGTLGAEGRLVVTEHYAGGTKLVIFNAYVPNAGGTGRPRLPFKLRFLDALYRQSACVVLCAADFGVSVHGSVGLTPALFPQHSGGLSLPRLAGAALRGPQRLCRHREGNVRASPPPLHPPTHPSLPLPPSNDPHKHHAHTHAHQDVHPELRPQDWLKEWGGGERAWFARALGRDGRGGPYIDTYRRHHPDEEGAFTFWAQVTDDRARNWGYRIDYVLVSRTGWGAGGAEGQGEGEEGVVAADILRAAMRTTRASDHAPVMAELALPPPTSVAAAAAAAGASGTGGEEEKKGGADGGGKGVGARAHAVGCVKHKVKGDVILAKLLPDPKQKSIRGFFVKKTAAAAASSASAPVSAAAAAAASEGNGNEEPAPKKARMEAAAAVPACKGKGLGKGAGAGGGGGALTKFFGKK